jgi:hypothetical protein
MVSTVSFANSINSLTLRNKSKSPSINFGFCKNSIQEIILYLRVSPTVVNSLHFKVATLKLSASSNVKLVDEEEEDLPSPLPALPEPEPA